MGLRLDWEIESEKENVRGGTEDAETKRARRGRQIRTVLIVLFVLLLTVGVITAIRARLEYVDWQITQVLRDTVEAEVTYLRLGDQVGFLANQRSASSEWQTNQLRVYNEYQTLKLDENTILSGQILDAVVDGQRGRVQVQEILNGTPYAVAWFYWRYEDGWRHAPQDTNFWGASNSIETSRLTVRYQALDEVFAQAVAERMNAWLDFACGTLTCNTLPMINVQIAPENDWAIGWADGASWEFRIPSPLLTRMRLDMPFDGNRQLEVATALAERVVTTALLNREMVYPTDAYYLRQGVISWLVGRFVGIQTNAFLIDSFANAYGDAQVGQLVAAMQPDSSLSILSQQTGATLDAINVDWRDYLTWRLRLETDLIEARNQNEFITLYDTREQSILDAAYTRFNGGIAPNGWVVNTVTRETDSNGLPILRATAQIDSSGTTQDIQFRLIDGVWKRIS